MNREQREYLRGEVDRLVRERVARLARDKSGVMNISILRGDHESLDWPPTYKVNTAEQTTKKKRSTYRERRRAYH